MPAAAAAAPAEAPEDVTPRRRVAVLLSRFPLITETFILREVMEMERQGQPVLLVPLIRERPAVVHEEARPWIRRALYTPWLSVPLLAANLRTLLRRPARYLETLALVVAGTIRIPGHLARSLALFPKAVYLAERLEEEQIGHLHAHFATHPATVALIIARLTTIEFSLTIHAHDIFVRRTLLRQKLKQARFVRVISEFNRSFLLRLFPELEENIEVIHCGVETERFRPTPLAAAGDREMPTLLCIAAFKPYKGHEVLLEALRLLRETGLEVRCELIGEGPLRRRLERVVARHGLETSVRFLGARTQDEVRSRIEGATLVVLPSTIAADGQMEGIPIVLMEAMAAGRPVVASRLSGIPELVEDGCDGLLVPPGDAPALADALRRLLADRDLASRLAARGPVKVARAFRLDRCVADLVRSLDGCCPAPPSWLAGRLERLAQAPPIGLVREQPGRDSRVAELVRASHGLPEHLVLKVHVTRSGQSRPPAERAAREVELLDRLGRTLGDREWAGGRLQCAVPRLVAWSEEDASLLLTRCPGQRLDRLVRALRWRRSPESRDRLSRSVGAAGVWLRQFQTAVAPAPLPRDPLAALVLAAEDDLRSARSLSRRERLQAGRHLQQLSSELSRRPQPHCPVHGDFWPGNLFVAEGRVEAIDFEGFRAGLPWEDPADFLVHLALFFGAPGLRSRFAPLRRVFLEQSLEVTPEVAAQTAGWRLSLLAVGLRMLVAGLQDPPAWPQRAWRREVLAGAIAGAGVFGR